MLAASLLEFILACRLFFLSVVGVLVPPCSSQPVTLLFLVSRFSIYAL